MAIQLCWGDAKEYCTKPPAEHCARAMSAFIFLFTVRHDSGWNIDEMAETRAEVGCDGHGTGFEAAKLPQSSIRRKINKKHLAFG